MIEYGSGSEYACVINGLATAGLRAPRAPRDALISHPSRTHDVLCYQRVGIRMLGYQRACMSTSSAKQNKMRGPFGIPIAGGKTPRPSPACSAWLPPMTWSLNIRYTVFAIFLDSLPCLFYYGCRR